MARKPRPRERDRLTMRIDKPSPGFFKTRLWPRGPWAPAIIYEQVARDPDTKQAMDRAPVLLCILNGEEVSPYDVWTRLRPITEAEYRRLVRDRQGVVDVPDINDSEVRI